MVNTLGNSDKAAIAVAYLISSCLNAGSSNTSNVDDKVRRMGAAAVPALLSALSDPDPDVNAISASLLGGLKQKALPALNELLRLMGSKSTPTQTRLCAARALAKLPGCLKAVTARLGEVLQDSTEQETFVATLTHLLGNYHAVSLDLYCLALRHPSASVRLAAAEEVTLLKGSAEPILAQLKLSLGDQDSEVRAQVASALSFTGTKGFFVLKATLLGSRNEQQRSVIVQAIGKMGARRATPTKVFGEVLVGEVVDIQLIQAVASALVQMGSLSIPYLKEALNHGDSRVIEIAADALERLGPVASEALPYLVVARDRLGLSPKTKESLAQAIIKLQRGSQKAAAPKASLHPVHDRFDVLQLLPTSELRRGREQAVRYSPAWVTSDLPSIQRDRIVRNIDQAEALLNRYASQVSQLTWLGSRQLLRLMAYAQVRDAADGLQPLSPHRLEAYIGKILERERDELRAKLGTGGYEIHRVLRPAEDRSIRQEIWQALALVAGWSIDENHQMPNLEVKSFDATSDIPQLDIKSGPTVPTLSAMLSNVIARDRKWGILLAPNAVTFQCVYPHYTLVPHKEINDSDLGLMIAALFFSAPATVFQPSPQTFRHNMAPGADYWGQSMNSGGTVGHFETKQINYFIAEAVQPFTGYRFAGLSAIGISSLARAAWEPGGTPLNRVWVRLRDALLNLGFSPDTGKVAASVRKTMGGLEEYSGALSARQLYDKYFPQDESSLTADRFRARVRTNVSGAIRDIREELNLIH